MHPEGGVKPWREKVMRNDAQEKHPIAFEKIQACSSGLDLYRHRSRQSGVTSHKAQGRTCERVVVAAARLDARSSYVACSRGRELCSVHTPAKAALMAHLPEGNRLAALDVMAANPRTDLSVQLRLPAYRAYYMEEKRHLAKWTDREIPYWWD